MSYDTKCFDLAEAFLEDSPSLNTEANRSELAQVIQDAIEGQLGLWEGEAEPLPPTEVVKSGN